MRTLLVFILLFTGLNECISQPIDRYFLGLPFRSPNAMQIDMMKSNSKFRPSYKSDYPEWMYFDAEYLDNRAIDPDCDSIKVILTSGFGSLTNLDRTAVIFYYQSRSLQTEKYDNLESQLRFQYPRYEYASEGDLTLNLDKMKGIVCWPGSDYYPTISLYQTTDEGSFAVVLEYAKVNER